MILLKDIDDQPYWRPYGGETIEEVRTVHKWELNAQKNLKDRSRSQVEMDTIRNVLMSISLLKNFLELPDEVTDNMVYLAHQKIAMLLYSNDHNGSSEGFDDNDNARVYLSMASFLSISFFTTWNAVSASVSQTKHE